MIEEFVQEAVLAASVLSDNRMAEALHSDGIRSELASILTALHKDNAAERAESAVSRLTSFIYRAYHCKGGETEKELTDFARPDVSRLLVDNEVIEVFQKRLNSQHYLDAGFKFVEENEAWPRRLERDGLILSCLAEDVELVSGSKLAIRMPRCFPYRSRGFVSFVGQHGPILEDADIVRIYLSFDFSGCIAAIGEFCEHADSRGIPYSLKVIGRSKGYSRSDNAVIYCDYRDFDELQMVLKKIGEGYAKHADETRSSIFCKQLWSGIAVAEEPKLAQSGESFGLHRSRLVAEGIERAMRASVDGSLNQQDVTTALRARFSQEDVSFKLPFLSYSWIDRYGRE